MQVPLRTITDKLNINAFEEHVPMNKRIRKTHLNPDQKRAFDESSKYLANIESRNQMLLKEIQFLERQL